MPRRSGFGRSPVGSGGIRRRSRVRCAATPPPGRGGSSTSRRQRSGTRSGEPAGPRRPGWPPTSGCGITSRTGFRVWSRRPTAELLARRVRGGRVGTNRIVGTAAGSKLGAPSRSPNGCRSISPMMSPCASATRRSIRPSTSKAVVRSSGNWWPVSAPGGRYVFPAPDPGRRPGRTSLLR